MYKSATEEVKEHNTYNDLNGEKIKLGRFLGSIVMEDIGLNPELAFDKKEQDKYWIQHPELKRK